MATSMTAVKKFSTDATQERKRVRFSLIVFFLSLPPTSFGKNLVYNIPENKDINSPQGYDAAECV